MTDDQWQMANDRWWITDSRWRMMIDEWRMTGDRWQTVDDGRWMTDDWQWTTDGGWRMTGDEWQMAGDGRQMVDDGWWMTNDKAGQVQSELSAEGTKRDIVNTPKCARPNCNLAWWLDLVTVMIGLGSNKYKGEVWICFVTLATKNSDNCF